MKKRERSFSAGSPSKKGSILKRDALHERGELIGPGPQSLDFQGKCNWGNWKIEIAREPRENTESSRRKLHQKKIWVFRCIACGVQK